MLKFAFKIVDLIHVMLLHFISKMVKSDNFTTLRDNITSSELRVLRLYL